MSGGMQGHPNFWKLPNSHRKGLEKITWLSHDVFQPNIRLMEEILHHIRSPKHGLVQDFSPSAIGGHLTIIGLLGILSYDYLGILREQYNIDT